MQIMLVKHDDQSAVVDAARRYRHGMEKPDLPDVEDFGKPFYPTRLAVSAAKRGWILCVCESNSFDVGLAKWLSGEVATRVAAGYAYDMADEWGFFWFERGVFKSEDRNEMEERSVMRFDQSLKAMQIPYDINDFKEYKKDGWPIFEMDPRGEPR